jgi:hypothetical protein
MRQELKQVQCGPRQSEAVRSVPSAGQPSRRPVSDRARHGGVWDVAVTLRRRETNLQRAVLVCPAVSRIRLTQDFDLLRHGRVTRRRRSVLIG